MDLFLKILTATATTAFICYATINVYRMISSLIRVTRKPRCEKCRAKMDCGNPQRLEANLVHQGMPDPDAQTYVAAASLRLLGSSWVYFTCMNCDHITEGEMRRQPS